MERGPHWGKKPDFRKDISVEARGRLEDSTRFRAVEVSMPLRAPSLSSNMAVSGVCVSPSHAAPEARARVFLFSGPSPPWGGGQAMAPTGMAACYTLCSEDKQLSLGIPLGDRQMAMAATANPWHCQLQVGVSRGGPTVPLSSLCSSPTPWTPGVPESGR